MAGHGNAFPLLTKRRFLPFFFVQFLGAFNDNVFRAALGVLILFKLGQEQADALVQVAGGVFMAPFFLFSAVAGQLADKVEKTRLIRVVKAVEIAVMGLAVLGFYFASVPLLMTTLFLMGTQSAFFGPAKYAILPERLRRDELLGGNALIEAATYLSILLGFIVGGLVMGAENGVVYASAAVLAVAALGFASALAMPKGQAANPTLDVSWNIPRQTGRIVAAAAANRTLLLSILGISWFWTVGLILTGLAQALAKNVFGGDETVFTLMLATLSIGIGAGSLLCSRVLGGKVSARWSPVAALIITLACVDLWAATAGMAPEGAVVSLWAFLSDWTHLRALLDILAVAVAGGFFVVPLYALLQSRSDDAQRSRVIAANNIVNAVFMVVGTAIMGGLQAIGLSTADAVLLLGLANLAVAIPVTLPLAPEIAKALLRGVFRLFYRVEVRGLENLDKVGERVLIAPNHQSFLDAPMLVGFLPGELTFAINTHISRKWWVRPFLFPVDALPIDQANPFAARALVTALREGKRCVIFPEGRITVTGALMKVYSGTGMIADKADAQVLPIRIEGAQRSPFSRLGGKIRRVLFPKIVIDILPPQKLSADPALVGRKRRAALGDSLQRLMSDVQMETRNIDKTLFEALVEARAVHGGKAPMLEDVDRSPIGFDRIVLGSLILGRKIADFTAPGERVGVMLPNSAGGVVTFFALQAMGRVPAMLNFSLGADAMLSALRTAEIRTVLTSRRFVELGKLERAVEALSGEARIVYLEDLRATIGLADKLKGLLAKRRPLAHAVPRKADDPAVVLFTSGSEGAPKGVVLSHRNLLANCAQLASAVDFTPQDRVFNALPIFHSFGLTGGTLLPLLAGVKIFMYPSPLHYRIVPELVYDTDATIMFGADTFLRGYARMAHPYDFRSVRYIFAGAEKVQDETRRVYADRFGARVLEGYGATETAPVLAVNTPLASKSGTVGRLLPGVEARLDPVPGIEVGGRLFVKGPNVMLGYMRAEKPGVIQPPEHGWYDTGDIVSIDAEGFVRIEGRAKRFAKIGGEMVSLGAVEAYANELWPQAQNAVLAVPDARKGEQLVLLTSQAGADRKALADFARARGASELMLPKTVIVLDKLPVLGTGKTDYVAAQKLAEEKAQAAMA